MTDDLQALANLVAWRRLSCFGRHVLRFRFFGGGGAGQRCDVLVVVSMTHDGIYIVMEHFYWRGRKRRSMLKA